VTGLVPPQAVALAALLAARKVSPDWAFGYALGWLAAMGHRIRESDHAIQMGTASTS
jgi:hypothetical protein